MSELYDVYYDYQIVINDDSLRLRPLTLQSPDENALGRPNLTPFNAESFTSQGRLPLSIPVNLSIEASQNPAAPHRQHQWDETEEMEAHHTDEVLREDLSDCTDRTPLVRKISP